MSTINLQRTAIRFLILAFMLVGMHNANAQWKQSNCSISGLTIKSLALNGSIIFAGTSTNGVFVSKDNGLSLNESNNGLQNLRAFAVAGNGSSMYAGTFGGGVFVTNNDGSTWTAINNGLTETRVTSLASNNSLLVAGTATGVYVSKDNGTSWLVAGSSLPSVLVNAVAAMNGNILAATQSGVFVSTDQGVDWLPVATDIGPAATSISCFGLNGTVIVAGSTEGAFVSTDGGLTWHAKNTGLANRTINAMTVSNDIVFVGTDGGGVYKTYDNGENWYDANQGLVFTDVRAFASTNTTLFVGTAGGGMFYRDLQQIIADAPTEPVATSGIPSLAFPNPFDTYTQIQLPNDMSSPEVVIYSVQGIPIRHLVAQPKSLSTVEVTWDGRSDAGDICTSGVYIARSESPRGGHSVRLVRVSH